MSLDVIQLVLGIVTFFTFVMAARTGVSVDEPRDTASAHTGDTEFIRR